MLSTEFTHLVDTLPDSMNTLMAMPPVTPVTMPPPREMPKSGIYLLSEDDRHIYVGRSRRIRARLQGHTRESSDSNTASFAFLLAREATGRLTPSYAPQGSRADLMRDPEFQAAFSTAKARIRDMQLRFIEETHPVRQYLLEVYVAVTLATRYNDFDSH